MTPPSKRITEGQRIQLDGSRGTVRYIGKLQGRGEKQWVGVEWDETSRGKHSGVYHGQKYFSCAPGAGSFLKLDRVGHGGRRTLLEAVKKRYAQEALDTTFRESMMILGGGLISIEDGDKHRREAVLSQREIVDLSGMGVTFVKEAGLQRVLPNVREVRIARSLFVGVHCLKEVLQSFPRLRVLDASGNILEVKSKGSEGSVPEIDTERACPNELEELILNQCSLSWTTVRAICDHSSSLRSLRLHKCDLGRIDEELQLKSKLEKLRVLDVDGNRLAWEDVTQYLGKLENLEEVYLSNNDLPDVDLPEDDCFMKVETLSLANNALGGWKVISWLQKLGALRHLRISGNPVTSAEEKNEQEMRLPWRMRVIGRIAGLEMLDGSSITKDERILCEKRYMSVEVASVWLKDEKNALCEHPRADELCRLYGTGDGTGKTGNICNEMVEVTLTALDKIPIKRKFAVRKMPLGARMSRVRAVGKRLLGIERHCSVRIGRLDQGSGDIEWETDLWRTVGHWANDNNRSELCVVIGKATVKQ